MFTIGQTAKLTGVPEASLRTWERRYAVVSPRRTDAGYRLYDGEAVSALTTMRRLIEAGWAPAQAARIVRDGAAEPMSGAVAGARSDQLQPSQATAVTHLERFLDAARRMDVIGIERSLDDGFALGSFEHVVDSWLFPTLEALGEGWARGEIDVAGEHAASHAVLRRLAAAFQAAAHRSRGPRVVVGLPPGSRHELGAFAFATALRRVGVDVLYLGADVPVTSWQAAVESHGARAAVLSVVTDTDRPAATAVTGRLEHTHPDLFLATGGAAGAGVGDGVHTLAPSIGAAATELEVLLTDPAA